MSFLAPIKLCFSYIDNAGIVYHRQCERRGMMR